jgi:ubiquinone/menaquinone biosynthesis C-methylase UbiE
LNIAKAIEVLGEDYRFSAIDTDKVIKELNLPQNAKILEVGTGMGSLSITLALNGYKVITGEPIDDDTIYANQNWFQNAEKVGVQNYIEFKPFNAKDTPFDSGVFDAVFCQGTFHHIEENEREKVLQEFVRITKSDGIICFFEPNLKAIQLIRVSDPSHPDAAEPNNYNQKLNLDFRRIEGSYFSAFIFQPTEGI